MRVSVLEACGCGRQGDRGGRWALSLSGRQVLLAIHIDLGSSPVGTLALLSQPLIGWPQGILELDLVLSQVIINVSVLEVCAPEVFQ